MNSCKDILMFEAVRQIIWNKECHIWFYFFISKCCRKTMPSWRHFACSCFLVRLEVNTIATRVPYLWLKMRGRQKGKNATALRWKTDTHIGVRFKRKHKNKICFNLGLPWVLSFFGCPRVVSTISDPNALSLSPKIGIFFVVYIY